MKKTFHSNGKLLLTSEYLVMDGAKALALPSRYGQSLEVEKAKAPEIHWQSFACDGRLWFEQVFQLSKNKITAETSTKPNHKNTTARVQQVLTELMMLDPKLFLDGGLSLKTHLEFPQNWGLGSSSTLIANLAKWAQVNPYELLAKTFGGSGYDIACAENSTPLIFQIENKIHPKVEVVHFDPVFKTELFFVHLNQKQNSREGIIHYRKQNLPLKKEWIAQASELTEKFLVCDELPVFENLISRHEVLLSSVLDLPTIKQARFPDYPRAIKSLGAWGGDFILATGGKAEKDYFRAKGYPTILDFKEMFG